MRKILSIGLAAVALSLSRGGIAEADVLYSQPWDGRTGGPSSQTVNGMNYYTVYDDFELRDSGTVTNMQWMGNYYNPDYQSQISQFTIQFWSDNAGQPGHLLETEIIPGTAGETFVLDNGTFREYSYDTDLPISFNAGAGIRYWMSIVPTTQYTTPQWAWSLCHDGTGQCWQRILGGSSLSSLSDDMAFTLNGVPEPSTFVLLAAGALGRAACVWRKRKPSLPSPWAGTLRRAA